MYRKLFLVSIIAIASIAFVPCAFAQQTAAKSSATSRPTTKKVSIFDGAKKTIVVHGYSTSYEWPAMLQRKLDKMTDGERIITVKSSVRGGTPIARWIDIKTGDPTQYWTELTTPVLKKEGDEDMIVICQESLQYAYDADPKIGIRNAQDYERIDIGADAIGKYVKLLQKDGADLVMVAMHIYKVTHEPEVGNERLALKKAMRMRLPGFEAGPDVWQISKDNFPKAFTDDRLHPNTIGSEIMAQKWFESLLKHDGKEVPSWSTEEMAKAIEDGQ